MFWKVLSLLGLAAACTPFEPGSDELPADSSPSQTRTGSLTAEVGRDWSCIGPLRAAPMVTRSNVNAARLVQSLQVLSLVAGTIPTGVSVRACAQRDVGCVNPLTPSLPLDAQGFVDLPLFDGFDGYLEIVGPEIVSTLLFYQDVLSAGSRRDTTPLGVVEKNVLPMLAAAIGTPQDPELGLLYLRVFDCKNDPAPGVQYEIDRPGVPWYFIAGLPSGTVVETEGSGLGGFLNVGAGITVVKASLSSGEREIALPKTIVSRPNWMTGLRLLPALNAEAAQE